MIEVMGKLTVVGDRNVSRIFDISGSTDTEITGGVLDGNDTTQSVWNNGILVTNATMTTIHDIHIKNFRNECIEFKESADFIIRNVTAENSGDDCFSIIYNSHNGVIEGNLCKNAGNYGIEIEDGSSNISVMNNICLDNNSGVSLWLLIQGRFIILQARLQLLEISL